MSTNSSLDGKVVLVIGGTTGMGLSAAIALGRQGAKVVVVGLDDASSSHAAKVLGTSAKVLVGDATEPEVCERGVRAAIEFGERLDGLYHVAGGSGRRYGDGPLHDVTDDGIDFTLSLNLKSLILSNRAAVRQFREQHTGGVILNMGSVLGFRPSPKFFATHVYAASKSAVIGFSRSIAAYYAPENIRCNVIAPGLIETPMSERAAENASIQAFIHTKQPLDGGRIGVPKDLDDAVVFLLSDASRFITGQTLVIDGGWSVSDGQFVLSKEGASDVG